VSVGGTNLLDENYELAWGYPDPGRNAYVRMRLNF
jgi:outer membrane cobalamin receptor